MRSGLEVVGWKSVGGILDRRTEGALDRGAGEGGEWAKGGLDRGAGEGGEWAKGGLDRGAGEGGEWAKGGLDRGAGERGRGILGREEEEGRVGVEGGLVVGGEAGNGIMCCPKRMVGIVAMATEAVVVVLRPGENVVRPVVSVITRMTVVTMTTVSVEVPMETMVMGVVVITASQRNLSTTVPPRSGGKGTRSLDGQGGGGGEGGAGEDIIRSIAEKLSLLHQLNQLGTL